jgi:hypothetical protein
MAMNPLPPQAFTKDTLQKAYQWLLLQSSSIKELATSQDVLVSLYLKAQRNGDASLETPTIQNFKQELKSLVNLMGDLQGAQPTTSSAQNLGANPNIAGSNNGTGSNSTPNYGLGVGAGATSRSSSSLTTTSTQSLGLELDSQSLAAIAEIRVNLNLGADSEALRALISIGYKHLKKI